MSHYETPTSRVTKSKANWEKRQKSRKPKLPKEDSTNWKLDKFVKLRR